MSRNLARVGTVAIFFLVAACSGEVAFPTAQATVVQPNVITGNVVRLDGSTSKDPQGRQLFFEWSFVSVADGSAATLIDANQMLPSFRADVAGDYVVQLVVSNGVVKSQPVRVTVHVTPCGFAAPTVAVATNSFNVTPRTAVHPVAVASDPDNQCLPPNAKQTVTVEWQINSRPPGSSAIVSDPSSATPTFTPDVPGDYQLRITATDSTGLTSPAAFVNITAGTCSLLAPTASFAAPVLNGTTGTAVNLTATVATNNCLSTGTFSYSWSLAQRPSGSQAFLSNPTASSPSFTPDVAGAFLVDLTVTDTSVGISSTTAVETVNVVRSACGFASPQIVNAHGTPALPSPGATVTLSAAATDRDNDPAGCNLGQAISFSWTPISAPSGSHAQLSDASAAAPTFVADVAGTYAFTVVATDSDGLASTPAGVIVQTAACAPALGALSSVSTIIGTTANLVAPAVTDSCVTSPVYTYRWTLSSRPAASSALLSGANSSTASFTPDVVGDYQAQLVVTDQGNFASAPAFVTVHAATCGTVPPTLSNLAASPTSPNVGDTIAFSVDVADLNGSTCSAVPVTPFKYSWSLVSKPRGSTASLALATSAMPLLVPDLPGSYQISVVVTDALGNSSDPAFLTTTTTNCGFFAPVAAIVQLSPIVTNSNTPVGLTATATSEDNTSCAVQFHDTFTFSWSIVTSPGSSRLTSSIGNATSFTAASAGAYVVQVVATATNGMSSAPAFVTINVSACGSASPVVVATSNNPAFPAPTQDVALIAQATDADTACGFSAPGLTWSIHSLPQGSATVLQNPGGAAHFVPDIQGTYVFRVVATDSTGLSSAPALVSVEALNPDPNASSVTASGGLTATLVVADNVDPGTLRMTVRNVRGNPIAQLPVRFDSSGSGNTFPPPGNSGTTDVNGVFVATMVSTKAEVKTFTATANPVLAPVVLTQHPSLEYVAGPTASIALTGLPGTVTAGDQNSVTITAFDQFLNVAKGPNAYTGTVHFTTTDHGIAAVIPGNLVFTSGDNGTHTFVSGVKFVTAGAETVTATDTLIGTFTSTQSTTVNSAPAANITLTGTPASTTAGATFSVAVSANDQFGNVAKGPHAYTGTVHFTTTDAGALAVVPGDYAFVSGDNGSHTFTNGVKLVTATSQTVTVTDTVTSTFTSSQTTTVNAAPTASITLGGAPTSTTAGNAFSVSVTAKDQFGNVATGPNAYKGTIHFTTTDAGTGAAVPANFTFNSGDHGTHAFTNGVMLVTAGSQTVTGTDTVNAALTSSQTLTVNAAAPSSAAFVQQPTSATAGVAISPAVTVNVQDAFANNVPGASVTLTIAAGFNPGSGTLTGGGAQTTNASGVATFSGLSIDKTGTGYKLHAAVTSTTVTADSSLFNISPAAAASFTVVVAPNPAATAVGSDVTVTALDAFNNVATGYGGTVHFTSTDGAATLPADSTLTNGTKSFAGGATFNTVGAQSLTAKDTVTSTITGTANVTVNAWFSTTNNGLHARRLAVDSGTHNVYAATHGNGVFISTDHGSSWSAATTQPTDTNVEEIAVAPLSILYAATATGGVFTSTNDGVTWSAANGTGLTDLNTLSIVADPGDLLGQTVYVGTTTDVFKTADGGATWSSTTFLTTNDPITALSTGGAALYAATVGGVVYQLTGTTWTNLLLTSPGEIDSLAFISGNLLAGTADGHVFLYNGTSWNGGVSAGTHQIFQIAFADALTGYVASAGDGVFKTADGGATWTAATTGITELKARGVAVDATNPTTTVFAGTDGSGFFKTLTAGQ